MRTVFMILAAATAFAADSPLDRAQALYNRTDYEQAARVLQDLNPKPASAWELLGRTYFMQGDFKRSSEAFEQAVKADPGKAAYHNWLGRAFGRRAETSSFLSAPGLASKARDSFQRAVELDPRNLEAASDLFEYYLEAPGFLGGGLDKAAALSENVRKINPAEYHFMQARIAEKRKQFSNAEEQFRLAAEAAPRQVGRVIDLAKFLAKRGRYQESEEAFARAEKIAPNSPKVMFERANSYVRAGRNLEAARNLLKKYLDAPLTPDDPPRQAARDLLKQAGG